MFLNSITLSNYKIFKEPITFKLSKINFITGVNGSGKTTLGLYGPLFSLFGYSNVNLNRLCNDNKEECSVITSFNIGNNNYTINRNYPSKIKLLVNGENLSQSTNSLTDKKICSIFGDIDYWKNYRMIDNNEGKNFADITDGSLKKILLDLYSNFLIEKKEKLLKIKTEREKFCKSGKIINHFYSKKRIEILNKYLNEYNREINDNNKAIESLRKRFNNNNNELGKCLGEKNFLEIQYKKLKSFDVCPTCNSAMDKELKKLKLLELEKGINEDNVFYTMKKVENDNLESEISQFVEINSQFLRKIDRIKLLLKTLEYSESEKNLIYSTNDIEIAKKALGEFDNFSTFYLIEKLAVLEPIINSILKVINTKINIKLDEKGNFTFKLIQNGRETLKEELSSAQKLIFQIALKLAILLERNETGLIIADEGMGSLDKNNLLQIIEIFNNFPFQLIFVLHHVTDMPSYVNVIKLGE